MSGWIKIHRKIAQHEIWNDVTTFRLFMFLIINAAHQDVTVSGIKLKRGQYLRSYSQLAEDLSYKEGRGLKKVSKNTIYKSVKKLIDNNMVTVRETELGTVFTIVNYEQYQGFDDSGDSEVGTDKRTNGERTVNEVGTNGELKQELKELKELKNDIKKTNVEDSKKSPKNISSTEDVQSFVDSRINELPSGVSRKILIKYFDCIRMTRSTCRISENILNNLVEKISKYSPDQINYALWLHFEQHDDKKENYTLGILRNTKEHEARRGLIKLKNRNGGVDIAVGQSSDQEYEYPF